MHGCKRDIDRDGAVATGVPHPLMGDGCSFGTVESHCATRRCLIPCSTASPDAVPQRPDWKSLCPERPSEQFLQRNGQACTADLFAGHPVALRLEEEGVGYALLKKTGLETHQIKVPPVAPTPVTH
jgi:hypothetical protein